MTPSIVRLCEPFLDPNRSDHRLLRAAIWVASTAMFRPGELTVENARRPDPDKLLTMSNISVGHTNPPVYLIHLKTSKTDRFNEGKPVRVFARRAITALRDYLDRRPGPLTPSSPLFAFDDGTPLSRPTLINATLRLLSAANIPMFDPDGNICEGVSFRKGGATWLASRGVPDRIIQFLGRWKTMTFVRYIHPSTREYARIFDE